MGHHDEVFYIRWTDFLSSVINEYHLILDKLFLFKNRLKVLFYLEYRDGNVVTFKNVALKNHSYILIEEPTKLPIVQSRKS